MRVVIQYVEGCPNWQVAVERLSLALRRVGRPAHRIAYEKVETAADAKRIGFAGSPTVLIDGRDPFSHDSTSGNLSCRLYRTGAGLDGAPSVDDLEAVLRG